MGKDLEVTTKMREANTDLFNNLQKSRRMDEEEEGISKQNIVIIFILSIIVLFAIFVLAITNQNANA